MARRKSSRSKHQIVEKKSYRFVWAFFVTLLLIVVIAAVFEKNRRDRLKLATATTASGQPDSDRVKPDSISALRSEYAKLIRVPPNEATVNRIERYRRRIELCNKIRKSAETSEDRVYGTRQLILSYAGFYTLDASQNLQIANLGSDLLQLADELKKDSDPAIRKLATVLGYQKQILDFYFSSAAEPDPQAMRQELERVGQEFPEDTEVAFPASELLSLFRFDASKTEQTKGIMEAIIAAWSNSQNPEIVTWVEDLVDARRLIEVNFFELDILARAPGESGSAAAADQILELVGPLIDGGIGKSGINAFLDLAEQFEINDWYDRAQSMYDRVGEHLQQRDELRDEPELTQRREFGLRRLECLGTRIAFNLQDLSGQEVSNRSMAGKALLVIYLSESEQLKALADYRPPLERMNAEGLETVILLCNPRLDRKDPNLKRFVSTFHLVADPNRGSDLFQACPVSDLPYMMLIDREGRVVDINVSQQELISGAENLLFK